MQESDTLLDQELVVINLGLESFADAIKKQEVDVVHIYWAPPAGGDEEMMDLLAQLL